MSAILCKPCAEPQECLEDLDRYNLQDDTFLFVLVCPPGIVCNGSNVVFLLCCDGTTLQGNIPLGTSITRRNQIISGLVAECERRRSFCGNPPDGTLFYSAPASCTVFCPDGTPFIYTVPAGVFIASTFEAAQAAAKAYACEQAPNFLLCLGQFNACLCAGTFFSGSISIQSNHAPFRVSVISGSFPAGMTLRTSGNSVIISGIPTTAGVYPFTIRVTDQFGNAQARSYTIRVLSITTSSITGYTVGVPYTFQLQASGGSGNYAWRIVSGTLPDGLFLFSSGVITGTPTGASGGGDIVFEVVDQTCESVGRSFFTPRAFARTVSTTRILTYRGWPVWTGTDTTLYKKIEFAGEMGQIALPQGNAPAIDAIQCAGARYEFSGSSEIDAYGRHTSTHEKNLFVMCPEEPFPSLFTLIRQPNGDEILNPSSLGVLPGYCWGPDPDSCDNCNTDDTVWDDLGNRATFGNEDIPNNMVISDTLYTFTPTVKHYQGSDFAEVVLNPHKCLTGFPCNNGDGLTITNFPYIVVISDGDWTATLSEPYTDVEAANTAVRYMTNGKVAENIPNYLSTSFQTVVLRSSRVTTVNYSVNCTNLIQGQAYRAIINFRNITTAAVSSEIVDFTAAATSHVITGSVPTPSANQRIQLTTVSIAFL